MPEVCAIWRHPIKGHGREALKATGLIKGQTMPWDRRWAVTHEATQTDGTEWAPCVNYSRGSKVPALMAINACVDEDTGVVTLTHPERPDISFDPNMEQDRFLAWVRPLMPANRAQSTGLHSVPGRGMTDSDYSSVSIINMASHDDLADKMQQDLSPLRWRCNIHLTGFDAWEERNWVGKTLRIGNAELHVEEPILRCLATTANPETGMRDADTLGALKHHWDHQFFGVYAVVTQGGNIEVGQEVVVV